MERDRYTSYRTWCRKREAVDLIVWHGLLRTEAGHRIVDGHIIPRGARKPVAHAILIVRAGGGQIAVSTKRLRPLAEAEAARWRMLERGDVLFAKKAVVVEALTEIIRKNKQRRLRACAADGVLYDLYVEATVGEGSTIRADPAAVDGMTPLTLMAANTTVIEHDELLSQLLRLRARLNAFWERRSRVETLLSGLLDRLTVNVVGYQHYTDGNYFSVNGRRYPAARRGTRSGMEDGWPRPSDRVIEVDSTMDTDRLY